MRKYYFVFSEDERSNDIKEWIKYLPSDIEIVSKPQLTDEIDVVGGDGTFLHAINRYQRYGKPFRGHDRGTLGFLLNPTESMSQMINDMRNFKEHTIVTLKTIRATITLINGTVKTRFAFNDVYVESKHTMLSGTVSAEGKYGFAERYFRGNGMIVATPQGSTAFNRSAGGKILPLEEDLLAVTSICSQIDPIAEVVEMKKVEIIIERGDAYVTADNRRINHVKKIVVEPSGKSIQVVFTKRSNFQIKRFHIEDEIKLRRRKPWQ